MDPQDRGTATGRGIFKRHEAAVIFFVGVFLLLPRIWCETSITGQDEYWLSFRTPMETMEQDSWLTPWVNGEPRLRKPPLLYWAILLGYKLLGIHLFAARIWGVLAGAGLAACSTLLYRELFRKSGILAGLITLATLSVAIEGRRAMLDLPLAFFTAMAVLFALRWGRSGRCGWILLAAFSLGLSFLIKGPVGIILFAVASLSALWVFGRWRFLAVKWTHALWALLLLLAVSLPWPIRMACLWPDFLNIIDSEVAARGVGTVHMGSPFSTLGGAFGLVFPWSLILLAAVIGSFRHSREPWGREGLWLSIWFLGCIVPFFFIRSFARYMTPLIPAAAVLCAHWLDQGEGAWRTTLLNITMSLMALIAVFFCLFFIWFGQGVPMAVICLMAVGLMLWMTFSKKDVHLVAGCVALLLCLLMGGLYPSLGINALPAHLNERIGSRPIAAFNSSQPSMLSIRMKRSAIRLGSSSRDDIRSLRQLDGFVFVRGSDIGEFEALAKKAGVPFEKAGDVRSFYSRQAWIRFAREDATAEDWGKALRSRSLETLKPMVCYYRVRPPGEMDTVGKK